MLRFSAQTSLNNNKVKYGVVLEKYNEQKLGYPDDLRIAFLGDASSKFFFFLRTFVLTNMPKIVWNLNRCMWRRWLGESLDVPFHMGVSDNNLDSEETWISGIFLWLVSFSSSERVNAKMSSTGWSEVVANSCVVPQLLHFIFQLSLMVFLFLLRVCAWSFFQRIRVGSSVSSQNHCPCYTVAG